MLDDLVRTVEKLRDRIKAHRDTIGGYEARTRVSLVDPMLFALGWDVGDPTHVAVEKVVGDEAGHRGRPDYALLGTTGNPVLFIEAKKLGVTREPIGQLVAYVVQENMQRDHNVSFCAWTNGDVWKLYDVVAQKPVLETQLSRDNSADCAFKLIGLWRTSLVEGSLRSPVKLHSEPSDPRDQSATNPQAPPAGDAIRRAPVSPPPSGRRGKPLPEVRYEKGMDAPRRLVWPDGEVTELTNKWSSMQMAIAEWLIDTGRLEASMLPLTNDRGTCLVDATGRGTKPKEVRPGFWMDTNLAPQYRLIKARDMLEACGVEPGTVRVEFR